MDETVVCPICETENPADASHCEACGERLEAGDGEEGAPLSGGGEVVGFAVEGDDDAPADQTADFSPAAFEDDYYEFDPDEMGSEANDDDFDHDAPTDADIAALEAELAEPSEAGGADDEAPVDEGGAVAEEGAVDEEPMDEEQPPAEGEPAAEEYPADEEEYPADEEEYPADEEEYPDDPDDEEYSADEEEYPADEEEYPADEEEYPADEEEYPADEEEYPADEEEYPSDEDYPADEDYPVDEEQNYDDTQPPEDTAAPDVLYSPLDGTAYPAGTAEYEEGFGPMGEELVAEPPDLDEVEAPAEEGVPPSEAAGEAGFEQEYDEQPARREPSAEFKAAFQARQKERPAMEPLPSPGTYVQPATVTVYVNREPVLRHEIDSDETLIGRKDPVSDAYPDLDLTEFDPESHVSRKHAYIYRQNKNYTLYAVSNSGTQLNSDLLDLGDRRALTDGDVIVLAGKIAMRFEEPEE